MREELEQYAKPLVVIRQRRLVACMLLLLFIAYTLLWVSGVIVFDRHIFFQPYILPLIIPILYFNWVIRVRCPRCEKRFFEKKSFLSDYHYFARECVHCGLPLKGD